MDASLECLEGRSEEKKEENAMEGENTNLASYKTKSYGISIDSGLIRSVPVEEQASVLRNLGVNVFNQDEFEEGVLKQVDEAIAVKETEEIVRGWERNLKSVDEDIKLVFEKLSIDGMNDHTKNILTKRVNNMLRTRNSKSSSSALKKDFKQVAALLRDLSEGRIKRGLFTTFSRGPILGMLNFVVGSSQQMTATSRT